MVRLIICIFFALMSYQSLAQDYMDTIVDNACNCISSLSDDLGGEELNMELGLCIIEAALPYQKQIKKEYKIDLRYVDQEGEALGRLIGVKMVTRCPEALKKMTVQSGALEESVEYGEVEGIVSRVDEGFFISFSVKDDQSVVRKFYWMTNVDSDFDMVSQYDQLLDRSVRITYRVEEFFDARIDEYRDFHILVSLTLSTQ